MKTKSQFRSPTVFTRGLSGSPISSLVIFISIGIRTLAFGQATVAPAVPATNAPPTAVPAATPAASAAQASPAPAATPLAAAVPGGTPAATPTAPPSEPAKRSAADLEKLVAPIALYPDQLIATILPASAYPLEIVQAARFVKDTNNVAKLDQQPWDENVKAVARIPDVIHQMDNNLSWTSDLGDAFINQPKETMDAIQAMRVKAQGSGALKTTPEQTVTVTNQVVTNVVETQTVVVTNQVVQIQPTQPDVVYVPQYSPTVVYGYPSAYVYPGYSPAAMATASVLSFGAGMAMGAWIANDCDWGHGDVNVNRNVNVNQSYNRNVNAQNRNVQNRNVQNQKWQPDQNRLKSSGSTLSSANAQNREARGWGGSGSQAQSRATGAGGTGATRRGLEGAGAQRPSTAQRPPGAAGANRPSTASRPSTTPRAQPSTTARSTGSSGYSGRSSSGGGSAFSGVSSGSGGGGARSYSQRGSASRGGGGGGGARGGGGGGRRR